MNNDSNNGTNNVTPGTNPTPEVPVNTTTQPVEPATSTTPVQDTPAPVVEQPATINGATVAPATNPAPVQEAPAPVVEQPAAINEATVAPATNPAPVQEAPAPVVEQPAAINEATVAPATNTTPVQEAPAPVVEQPAATINGATVPTAPAESGTPTPTEAKKPANTKLIIFGILILVLAGVFVFLLTKGNGGSSPSPTPAASSESTLAEGVSILGHACTEINGVSKCNVTIDINGSSNEYVLNSKNNDLFIVLSNYSDKVKVNVYYTQAGNEKTIVDYKLFLISTSEDITSVANEAELRSRLNMYAEGDYTESLTLTEIGTSGVGSDDNGSYTYESYVFTDANGNSYEMKYKNGNSSSKLTVGNSYTVTFTVVKDTLGYEYNITNIQ